MSVFTLLPQKSNGVLAVHRHMQIDRAIDQRAATADLPIVTCRRRGGGDAHQDHNVASRHRADHFSEPT